MCLIVFIVLNVKLIYLFITKIYCSIVFFYFFFRHSIMHEQAYVCMCMYMHAYASACVFEYACVCRHVYVCVCVCRHVFVCVLVCMNMLLFFCFTNYNLPIVCYQQCTKGKRI